MIGLPRSLRISVGKCLHVTTHATFGKLKALIMNSACTCSPHGDDDKTLMTSACLIHCQQPQLADILYEVIRHVHEVFGDKFMCFANLFFDETARGRHSFRPLTIDPRRMTTYDKHATNKSTVKAKVKFKP